MRKISPKFRSQLIRSLLWGVALCLFVLVAISALSNKEEAAIVNELERMGCFVYYKYYGPSWLVRVSENLFGGSYPFKSVRMVELGYENTGEALELVRYLKQTRAVFLNGTKVGGSSLIHLSDLPRLEEVDLTASSITDDGMQYLATLQTIKRLSLARTKITDRGVPHLVQLKKLESLDLRDTAVTDHCLTYLVGLPLKELDVRGTSITSTGIAEFKKNNPVVNVVK